MSESHVSTAKLQSYPGGVLLTCAHGHVLATIPATEFPGSLLQTRAGTQVSCRGTL